MSVFVKFFIFSFFLFLNQARAIWNFFIQLVFFILKKAARCNVSICTFLYALHGSEHARHLNLWPQLLLACFFFF